MLIILSKLNLKDGHLLDYLEKNNLNKNLDSNFLNKVIDEIEAGVNAGLIN